MIVSSFNKTFRIMQFNPVNGPTVGYDRSFDYGFIDWF